MVGSPLGTKCSVGMRSSASSAAHPEGCSAECKPHSSTSLVGEHQPNAILCLYCTHTHTKSIFRSHISTHKAVSGYFKNSLEIFRVIACRDFTRKVHLAQGEVMATVERCSARRGELDWLEEPRAALHNSP